jgi:hypothetical protein
VYICDDDDDDDDDEVEVSKIEVSKIIYFITIDYN